MKSSVEHVQRSSSSERRDRRQSSSSSEDRYRERERSSSPRDRGYSDRDRDRGYSDRDRDRGYSDCDRDRGYSDRDRDRGYSGRDREYDRRRDRGYSDRERDRGYADRRRYDDEDDDDRSRNGRYDRSAGTQDKDRDRGRPDEDRDTDRRRQKRLSPSTRKSEERSEDQPSTEPPVKKKKEELDPILTRTGGAYIPPARLRMMQEQISDKSSLAYQRMSWEALKKSINGLINKVNVSNIGNIIQELLQENIVRGRGQLARSVLQAQSASPIFTHVYAAVVSIINSKFPQIGELILKRLILNFRKGYRRNDKQQCLTASKFVAHLINQNVAHEVLALEMLTLLLERPNDDSVEVSIGFIKESGLKLTQVTPRGINAIFERLRNILHESEIDKRVQYMIEVMFAVRKDGFKDHPVIPEGLDLVEEEDQFTHMLPLEDEYNQEDVLNVFKMDPNFLENEEKYKAIKREILDEGDSDSDGDEDCEGSDDDSDEEDDNEEAAEGEEKMTIHDKTEVNLVSFRRTIYLAIQSSLDFEECAHKLIKMDFPDSQTKELCNMILDCCAQQRTYEKFFGLLAGRFCLLKKEYMEAFENIFKEQYDTIHRLETNKLRNVAKMFAHLLYTDSIPWSVLECINLSEETTTSSSRIFVKIFFQELCEYMGLPKLNARLKDATLQPFFQGLLPMDNPKNTRFAINFFTSIGLGGLTDELREHLKNAPKMIMTQKQNVESSDSSCSDSTSGSDSSDSDSSSDSSSSSSSDSESSSSSSSSDDSRRKKSSEKKKRKTSQKTVSKKHTREDKTREDKTREDKTREDKTREDKTREDKTREDKRKEAPEKERHRDSYDDRKSRKSESSSKNSLHSRSSHRSSLLSH